MGPMSLAVDGRGNVWVLDQVNGRIVKRGPDGRAESSVPIELPAAQDLAVADDGSVAVLDRFDHKAVALFDETGAPHGELPLGGEGIDDTGLVTGIVVDGDSVYAEREHGALVLLGNTAGAPADPRSEIPGRPSRDGKSFLNAGITDAQAGRTWVSSIDRATGDHRFTREVRLAGVAHQILLLDTDKSGTIYFAVEIAQGPSSQPVVILTCLEPLTGLPVGSATLPANTLPEETFKDFTVLDDGGVIYAHRTEAGVTYQQYDCQ